jgi:hypothetical protein
MSIEPRQQAELLPIVDILDSLEDSKSVLLVRRELILIVHPE